VDEELIELAKQMNLQQTQKDITMKVKEATTSELDLTCEGTCVKFLSSHMFCCGQMFFNVLLLLCIFFGEISFNFELNKHGCR
jgi:hypothetical protein